MRSRLVPLAAALTTALALAAPAAGRPYGFLATPTDQLAVLGHVAGFEVTPEGFVYGGYGELVFRAGPQLLGLRAPVRTLEGARYPVLRYGQRFGGVRYDLDVLASLVGGQPVAFVRMTMHNTAPRAQRARRAVGVRYSGGALKANGVRRFRFPRPIAPERPGLITQPGTPFAPGWSYGFGDGTIVRDGQVVGTFAPRPQACAGGRVGAGALRLPGRAGELRIAWRLPLRPSSFDGVTAALQKAYRARGAKPPS